jgi:hypothetical protein
MLLRLQSAVSALVKQRGLRLGDAKQLKKLRSAFMSAVARKINFDLMRYQEWKLGSKPSVDPLPQYLSLEDVDKLFADGEFNRLSQLFDRIEHSESS